MILSFLSVTVAQNSVSNREDEDLISRLDDLPESDSQFAKNTVKFAENNNQNESNETSFGIEAKSKKRYVRNSSSRFELIF